MEHPIKMDDLGRFPPIYLETSVYWTISCRRFTAKLGSLTFSQLFFVGRKGGRFTPDPDRDLIRGRFFTPLTTCYFTPG